MNHVDIRVAPQEPWYKYGVAVLLFEIAVAIAVSGYSLYMTFNSAAFPESISARRRRTGRSTPSASSLLRQLLLLILATLFAPLERQSAFKSAS
jgi:hypothetical protein